MSTASSALTLALGAGGGLAAWYLTRDDKTARSTGSASPGVTAASGCALRLDPSGLTADGARVALHDAIERCKAAGRADVTIVPGAPAATYAELMIALGRAGVPTSAHRNAGGARRNVQRWARYTLRIYPQGSKGPAQMRWFRARAPIPWSEARLRLERAGVMDPWLAGKTSEPGGWMMSVVPRDFRAERAEPMPALRNNETSSTFTLAVFQDGIWGTKRVRWFRADPPTTWEDARDRLVAAGMLDPSGRAGTWKLITDPVRFRPDRAEPLPNQRNAEISSTFTLSVYPQGDRGPKRVRWFYADPPTTWDDARDRLAAARLIDLRARSPHLAGAWKLVTDPRVFDAERAKPLPSGTRDAARSARYSLEGRTILRDGEAILHLERVDLGDERYAITPHAADVLAQQIVDLLNGRRSRRQAQRVFDVGELLSGGDRG